MTGRTRKNYAVAGCYVIVALFIAYIVVQYLVFGPKQAGIVSGKLSIPGFPYNTWQVFFFVHIATGSIALLTGPFQFLRSSRKVISVHRIMGRIYGISIFVSVPAGIYLALYATGGLASSIGFIVLDVAWFMTAFVGLKRIREKKVTSHQEWMLRSYAVTLVFVTFRVFLPLLTLAGLPISLSFPLSIYFSMAVNLGWAEWHLRRKKSRSIQPNISA
ncbi:Predicted membrane protein [Fictibacillus enclensis]|uniref:DUF2306 domain-containing protein n=1 Tax=Fictibacillus enclensis TaxID=1017270 RepID=A0A0V8JB49_9BACL|nr:DUF2306 domain-containing protein [Fictibacillus enclensis]KSU84402.1 hypothetical protein AS030_02270 [Fictibacillus enclensis]SCB78794.1 Predicted membrane protein [Fictibacillus enclensis]